MLWIESVAESFVVRYTNGVRLMVDKNKIKKNSSDKTLLNPQSEHFDFELWAKEVSKQMQAAFGNRSSQAKS